MIQAILELVPIAILVSVSSIAWRGSKKFTTINLRLDGVIANTEKHDKGLHELSQRVAGVEGQLKRMNGG